MSTSFIKDVYARVVDTPSAKARGMGKILRDGTVYYVSGLGVLQSRPTDEEASLSPGVFHPLENGVGLPSIGLSTDFSIGGMLSPDSIAVHAMQEYDNIAVIPVTKLGEPSLWVVKYNEESASCALLERLPIGSNEFMLGLSMRWWTFPQGFLDAVKKHGGIGDTKTEFRIAKNPQKQFLVIVLYNEACNMFTTMANKYESRFTEIRDDGVVYKLDAWNDNESCFKNIKEKKQKMAKLGNPVKREVPQEDQVKEVKEYVSETAPVPVAETRPAEQQTEVHDAEPAATNDSDVKDVVQEEPAVAQESPAVAQDQESDQADGKQKIVRRPKSVAAVGFDFTKILEFVGSQVDISKATPDKIAEELRNLRDLQIGCARRACNLATAALEQYRDDYERYQELKRMFIKK